MANQGLLDTSFGPLGSKFRVSKDEIVGSEAVVMVPTQMRRGALPFVGNHACGVVEGWDAQAESFEDRIQWL